MIVIPAVDLRGGACVQLVGGSYDDERVRIDNPREVARNWTEAGFRKLHVVDLDAATGRGSNATLVRDLLVEQTVPVQVGGGVRDAESIQRLLNEGADSVVVGTRAFEDPDWLEEMARMYPGHIIVAADVRGRKIVTRGWSQTLSRDIVDVIEDLNNYELAGVMVTAVHIEGQMSGADIPLMEDVVQASTLPILASGGISGLFDLRELQDRGVSAAIVGMALYTGALDPRMVAEEFSE
jgi:phosphoribosylformimino-5-aminoimidazole carboxamide ribotide isomerase